MKERLRLLKASARSQARSEIESLSSIGEIRAIVPRITGSAWIADIHQLPLDPDDPDSAGHKLCDTSPEH